MIFVRVKVKKIRGQQNDCALPSGGAATAISSAILKKGGIVFGVAYTNDYKSAHYVGVTNESELCSLKGSKYFETKKNFDDVLNQVQSGRLVLFIGLGCDVAAVKALCQTKGISVDNLYTIDILCHGPAPESIQRKYVEDLEQLYHSRVISFNARYKKEGWTPSYIHAEFENGKVYEELLEFTDFGYVFSHFALSRCKNCHFKGHNHCGDLCIGDCFGLIDGMSGYNRNGVSCIITQTPKGEKLLTMLGADFHLEPVDENLVLDHNPMYNHSRTDICDYKDLLNTLTSVGLHAGLKSTPSYKDWRHKITTIKIKRKILLILNNLRLNQKHP